MNVLLEVADELFDAGFGGEAVALHVPSQQKLFVCFTMNIYRNENNRLTAKLFAQIIHFLRTTNFRFLANRKDDSEVLRKSSAPQTFELMSERFTLTISIRILEKQDYFSFDVLRHASILLCLLSELYRIRVGVGHRKTSS